MKNQARHFGRLRRAEMCTAYIFILPMFAGLLLFSIIPFIQNILYSFRKMGTFGEGTFIGLKNYQDLLKDDTFWLALQNTVFYAVVGVPLVIIFSIFLAHQINKKIRGRTIYRTLLFIPAITIPAAIGILWRWILNYQYGIFNWILEKLGFSRISWLGDVKYVRWAIILVVVWSMVSYYVIIMLAAMQGIDSSYYEAARLDGASSRQVFFKITLPMLTPMIFFSVIMVTIGILQIFDFIYLMVDRQTLSYTYSMSLVTYFYECAFNKSSMRGYGAAISVVLAAIIMVITMIPDGRPRSTGSDLASERGRQPYETEKRPPERREQAFALHHSCGADLCVVPGLWPLRLDVSHIHQDVRGDHSDPHEVPAGDSPMGEFQHRLR